MECTRYIIFFTTKSPLGALFTVLDSKQTDALYSGYWSCGLGIISTRLSNVQPSKASVHRPGARTASSVSPAAGPVQEEQIVLRLVAGTGSCISPVFAAKQRQTDCRCLTQRGIGRKRRPWLPAMISALCLLVHTRSKFSCLLLVPESQF